MVYKNPEKREKLGILLVVLIMVILISPNVLAANIGISPARVYIKEVLRGGYAEDTVIITIDSEDPIGVSLQTRGELESWLNFSNKSFNVSK